MSVPVWCLDNILDDKPEGKNSAEKEEPPADEVPKRTSKKPERATHSKGKVRQSSNNMLPEKMYEPHPLMVRYWVLQVLLQYTILMI